MPDMDVATEQHLKDCDWPVQKQLINYKLDTITQQFSQLNLRMDTVISNQAMAAGTDKYKKNVIPNVIQVGMFLVALAALAIAFLHGHGGP